MKQNDTDSMRKDLIAWIAKARAQRDKATRRGNADATKYLTDYIAYCEARLVRLEAARQAVVA